MVEKKAKAADEPTQQLGARVPKSLYKKLNHYAIDHEMKIKDALIAAIEEFLKNKR